ncbi:MAG TPA: RdgB/HAM1 family non-canonical purine NTP pyrophosphatase [Chthoniobacterales bacterium]|nr:RdgB/HAM1 family non-canonical purine NTP pyrophosphatase [Chthoniobacterales bacterium]
MDLLIATHNAHKTREIQRILGAKFAVRDLSERPDISKPLENGKTFEENAILKVIAASRGLPSLVIADDSGLEVDALGGAPGIYSARSAGGKATDKANIDKLLRELAQQNVPADQRTARFRCVVAAARNGTLLRTFEGVVEGTIVDLPRGSHGFGYDPVFQPKGFDQTFGEMASQLKNKISHRAKAIVALREALRAGEIADAAAD